jgi:hypothetical protein
MGTMKSGARQLRGWLRRGRYLQREAAKMFGVSESMMSFLVDGERVPGRELAVKIESISGIPVASWALRPRDIGRVVSLAEQKQSA